ncbi:MAG: EF hand [Syntrophus sp. PtaB.Bin001]|nr:MAG: EF hand [Syntrophus sp. PtaB.Bin001]
MISGVSSSPTIFDYLDTQSTTEDLFSKTDTDSSGGISESELETLAEQLSAATDSSIDAEEVLSTYDADDDGELSGEELKSFLDATMQSATGMMGMQGSSGFFNEVDTDGSGGISEEELTALASNIAEKTGQTLDISDAFSTYDSDGDGELSDPEMKSFMDAGGIKPPPPQSAGIGGTGSKDEESTAESITSNYDANRDGALNGSELQVYLDTMKQSSVAAYDNSSRSINFLI